MCDGDFSWLLRTGEIEGVGAVELVCVGRLSGWVMNLFYCLCGDLLEVGSPVKESRMPGNFMGWEEDGLVWGGWGFYQRYLPSPPVGWMRSSVGAWWGRENCWI